MEKFSKFLNVYCILYSSDTLWVGLVDFKCDFQGFHIDKYRVQFATIESVWSDNKKNGRMKLKWK